MSLYQPGVPTGTVNLDVDYQNLQKNFQQMDTTFNVGHTLVSDKTAQNGFHRNIQMIPNSTLITNPPNNQPPTQPATVAGFGQLWSAQINDLINQDEALYFLTGGGRNIQLTRNFTPSATGNGFTFLPGGLILQWGTLSAVGQTLTPVTFVGLGVMSFPTSCFIVLSNQNTSGTSANTLNISSLTNLGFTYFSTSSITRNYFWMALGI